MCLGLDAEDAGEVRLRVHLRIVGVCGLEGGRDLLGGGVRCERPALGLVPLRVAPDREVVSGRRIGATVNTVDEYGVPAGVVPVLTALAVLPPALVDEHACDHPAGVGVKIEVRK